MRSLVSHAWVSIITYAICIAMWKTPIWAAPLVVSAAILLWFLGAAVASRQYRYRTDTDSLNAGECPACKSNALIEVTSGRDPEGQRRVICRDCSNGYAIIAEGDDFVTERLGKTRVS
jgi:hypothetical protein